MLDRLGGGGVPGLFWRVALLTAVLSENELRAVLTMLETNPFASGTLATALHRFYFIYSIPCCALLTGYPLLMRTGLKHIANAEGARGRGGAGARGRGGDRVTRLLGDLLKSERRPLTNDQ